MDYVYSAIANDKRTRTIASVARCKGALAKYADPSKMSGEENAWQEDVLSRHTQLYREWLEFGESVDGCSSGSSDDRSAIKVCSMPQFFLDMGFEKVPVFWDKQHLLDALRTKGDEDDHWCGLTIEQVKKLPELLENPVFVADDPAQRDSVLILLEETDSDGLPLLVAMTPSDTGGYELSAIRTNTVLAVFGKRDFPRYFSSLIVKKKRLVYVDGERVRNLESLCGRQLFEHRGLLRGKLILRNPQVVVDKDKTAWALSCSEEKDRSPFANTPVESAGQEGSYVRSE